jgi:hypothetical protein
MQITGVIFGYNVGTSLRHKQNYLFLMESSSMGKGLR